MKKNLFLAIFSFTLFWGMANPFFNSGSTNNPPLQEKTERQHIDSQADSSFETTTDGQENSSQGDESQQVEETQKKSGPSPVMVGKTNEKLTVFQGDLREQIATFFRSWTKAEGTEKTKILWSIIGIAFLYGMIHAAGPGHRKTIVFSLYIARKSPWYEPLITGILLALLHGGCAIVLMLIFKGISGSIATKTNAYSIYMEGFSCLLIIVVALFLIIKEIVEFVKTSKTEKAIVSVSDNQQDGNTQSVTKNNSFGDLIPFLISGLYPCPGAILVLVLSFTLDILEAGIVAVSFMSLGMAIPIIIVAYLAWFGRKGLFSALKNKEGLIRKLSFGIEIFGYSLLILFSLYIGMPFFVSLF